MQVNPKNISTGYINTPNSIKDNSNAQVSNTAQTPQTQTAQETAEKVKVDATTFLAQHNPIAANPQNSPKLKAVREEIKKLEAQLKYQMAHPPRINEAHEWGYYEIGMDKIQKQIAELRKELPLDRTNFDDVMVAKPMDFFKPIKADNIKGKGISFVPVVPTDREGLEKVTYKAVPIFTNARTIEEMIRIGGRDGLNIELPKFADDGEYHAAIKNVWNKRETAETKEKSEKAGETLYDKSGYFEINRPSAAMVYENLSADDEWIDTEWAQANKNAENQITNAAVIANSENEEESVAILNKSYVHEDGSPITSKDMTRWNGFRAHKDGSSVVNAVAFDEEKELMTLEGPIKTDVTMGDVEGFVYNNFKELKKQILKNKITVNPSDPNSQVFVDLIKAGKDDEALALLKKVTAETM